MKHGLKDNMHAIFALYGIKQNVDHLLMDMQAQKFKWDMWKGKKKHHIYFQGQLRLLPFGVYEYIFPKEHKDVVLRTLDFQDKHPYSQYGFKLRTGLAMIRKALSIQKTPPFDMSAKLLWFKDNVTIFPLGIREDREMTEDKGDFKGWSHEAL